MEEKICLEGFKSQQKITPKEFYVYTLKVIAAPPTLQADSVLNSAVRRLNKRYAYQGYFAVRNQECICTVKEIAEDELHVQGQGKESFSYELQPQGKHEAPLTENRIYEGYIKQLLERDLLRATRKYQRSPRDVLVSLLKTSASGIRLLREYHFTIKVAPTGDVFLYMDTFSRFDTQQTVYQQIKACNRDRDKLLLLRDEFVIYDLNTSFTQAGYIHSLKKGKGLSTRESLVNYYKTNYPQKSIQEKIAQVPPDDHVVQVRLKNSQTVLSYLASFLKPVMTTEIVAQRDRPFFWSMQSFIKRPMRRRLEGDREVLADLPGIAEFAELTFQTEPIAASERDFTAVQFALPQLIAGNDCHIKATDGGRRAIFRADVGYYRAPQLTDAQLKIQFVNQTGKQFAEKAFFNSLMDLALRNTIKAAFAHASLKFCHDGDGETPDILLVLVPEKRYANYGQLKKSYAQKPVPSQMITTEQANKILRKAAYANNVAQNIAMGILGKLGGIPYVLANIPGADETDLFVGLDVGMKDVKLHYPACSVVLDGRGEFLGCYEPAMAQTGEIIDNEHLRELFDAILTAYQQKYQRLPQNIVIHRDGFSHEDENWYETYFGERNINYSIFEIRKSGAPRIADLSDEFFNNPPLGTALIRGDEGYLVTSAAMKNVGAPQPLHIVKKCGELPIETAMEQIYCLTKIHTGSLHNLRLPVTTYYADQICKSLDYLPKGQFIDKLYFL